MKPQDPTHDCIDGESAAKPVAQTQDKREPTVAEQTHDGDAQERPPQPNPHPMSDGSTPYKVGRGKPPREYQFPKGRSGNPSGRPRKSESLDSCISKELEEKIALTESSGERRYVSKREAFSKRLVNDGLNGKPHAQEILVKHLSKPGAPVAFEANAVDEAAFSKTLASIAAQRPEEEKRGSNGDGI